jgi:hypothetical protein
MLRLLATPKMTPVLPARGRSLLMAVHDARRGAREKPKAMKVA